MCERKSLCESNVSQFRYTSRYPFQCGMEDVALACMLELVRENTRLLLHEKSSRKCLEVSVTTKMHRCENIIY